jgi:hypothetical protein
MKRLFFGVSAAAMIVLAAFPSQTQAAQDDGHVRFVNKLSQSVEVRILEVNGELDKKERIKPRNGDGFHFGGCRDRTRKFEIRLVSDDTLVGSGTIEFEGMVEPGIAGMNDCDLRLKKPDWSPSSGYSLTFHKVSEKRGRFTAKSE